MDQILSTSLATQLAGSPDARDHHLPGHPPQGAGWEPRLLLREQLPPTGDRSRPVLYVHGATFPSALSILFKFDGRSWADNLNASGFDVFGLDFAGYGGSERYPGMTGLMPAPGAPQGRSDAAAAQIFRAARYILEATQTEKLSIIAHSWGTIAAGRFASEHPEMVERLVLFGAIACRSGAAGEVNHPWQLVTNEQQHARFVKDVPPGHAPVLVEHEFGLWGLTYLDSDPESRRRRPAAVAVPSGPAADIAEAWSGRFPYDMSRLTAPVLLVSGAWDSSSTEQDRTWLRDQLVHSKYVKIVTIPKATHLMHLETGRTTLYGVTDAFLLGKFDD